MANFPDVEWKEVDGVRVPFTKPQHYKKGSKTETELTGHDNPLPVAGYGMTESGIWIPRRVDDDGNTLTQLTGSNVEDKLDRIARSETIESGSSTGLLDLGITNEKRIFVYVNVDKSPWTLRATRSTSNRYSSANLLIPQRRLESEVEVNGNLAIGTMLLSIDHLDLDLERPDTMTEAINLGYDKPIKGQKIELINDSDDVATVDIRIHRIWS